ncbi:MAG: hypothetical protein PHH12_02440 [Candidatus Shapirobacteria bacterium]|jgi:hypothetical protein|nr:hypothetical protein [Candidatus Shapirobacteria bacterium]
MGKKSIKGFRRVSWFRVLITVLILTIGLVFGVKLVQQSQENRSSAAGTATVATGYVRWYGPSNTSNCKNVSGTCAYFNAPYSAGTACVVNGVSGFIKTGLCGGGSSTLCCSTRKSCYINGNTYPDGTTFCNGRDRVYVCEDGRQIYRGLDCTSTKRVCNQGRCVTGTDYGAEKCVAKKGVCQTTSSGTLPVAGSNCTVNGKAGRYSIGLCGGQYATNFMCCIPK